MDSMTFLERAASEKPRPLYVLTGDEAFLKRQVREAVRRLVLGPDDGGFAESSYPGDKATWTAVIDDLQTLPFLSPRRVVTVENADPFVSKERGRLEKFVTTLLAEKTPPTGVLVLDVGTWPANTKLAKLVPETMTITCKAPATHTLPDWCLKWCAARHGKQLAANAARLLVDLVGQEMGLLDQELQKLAVFVGEAPRVELRDVDALVGRSRGENTFQIFKLIAEGKPGDALAFLGRLIDQGEDEMKLLGAFSWQLRRLAQVARLVLQGATTGDALERASVPPFARRQDEMLLRHLGRRRLDQLYDWLLQTDLGMKGGSALPPRALLERLVVNLARPRT